MGTYETFSTTADVGLRIHGQGFEDLCENAIKGLVDLIFDGSPTPVAAPASVYPFEFHGDSPENVLVNLLSEVAFLVQHQGKIITAVNVKRVSETYINIDLIAVPTQSEPQMEIKSVTYHNLKIKKENGLLSTEIIFDI